MSNYEDKELNPENFKWVVVYRSNDYYHGYDATYEVPGKTEVEARAFADEHYTNPTNEIVAVYGPYVRP